MTSRAVIGAGISGLLAARRAASSGEDVTIFSPNVGGQITGVELAGVELDAGAESLSIVSKEGRELLEELGLENKIVTPLQRPAKIISKTGRVDLPKGFFGIPADLDEPSLKLVFSEVELESAKKLDAEPFGSYDTVANLIEKRLGRAFLDRVISPVIYGVHSSSPEKLSAKATFPRLLELAAEAGSLTAGVSAIRQGQERAGASVISLRGGMHTLVATLFASLGNLVKLVPSKVSGITKENGAWIVRHDSGSDSFDALTLACPANQIVKMMDSVPMIVSAAADVVQVDSWVALVHAKSKDLNGFPLGTGALVAEDAGLLAKATTHVSAKWSWVADELKKDHHLIRLSFGRDGELKDPANLEAKLRDEIVQLYGAEVEILGHRIVHWENALAQPSHDVKAALLEAIANQPSLELVSGFAVGNGILGIVRDHNLRRATWA